MKKSLLCLLVFLFLLVALISCEKHKEATVAVDPCEGYKYTSIDKQWDSVYKVPFDIIDSVTNGYHLYSLGIQFPRITCFNDTLKVAIIAEMKANQPRPINIRAYIDVDYLMPPDYFEPIPLHIDNQYEGETWVSGVNEDFYWKFLPSPHTQGRDLGFIKVHVDYLVPIGTDYYTDMQYLFSMGNTLSVDFFYYADQTGQLDHQPQKPHATYPANDSITWSR